MKGKKLWEIGGFVAGGILIVFGVAAITNRLPDASSYTAMSVGPPPAPSSASTGR